MKIRAISGDISAIKADAIIISVFEEARKPEGELARIDKKLGGAVTKMMKEGEVKGKLSEIALIHSLGKLGAGRVAVVGLGKKAELTQDKVRQAAGETLRYLKKKGVATAASLNLGAGAAGISPEDAAQTLAEAALLGTYSFDKHLTKKNNNHKEIKELSIVAVASQLASAQKGIDRGVIIAEAANLARDMTNEPANFMTPTEMANVAKKLAGDYGLELTITEKKEMKALGMGGVLSVNQGSAQPPKFIILSYRGRKTEKVDIALVGKGVTFDSGGISIKPSEGMGEMKGDMAGGAAVIAAIGAIAQLKPKVNVVALCAATENMPDADALKPGDIITIMNGKTVEIISTDAEGRLTLADVLCYAVDKLKAKNIVDVATLTGACRVALGDITTGAFANNQALADRLLKAAKETGEYTWQMPMYEEYKEQNKSDVADIKNAGNRWAGAITAALFLSEFAGETPWVHLDIAGTSDTDKDHGYQVKGATGVPVRTLVKLVMSLAK
ncbi:MAG: leucyl aminopeptidase [Dehalococcoidia bacterium]|nr:MAG: leucyl aminopeptidase [Dehalococcoidia bacterium]